MTSAIIATDPVATVPTTQSVRDNFAVAKSEISALQLATTTTAAITGGTITGVTLDNTVIGGGTAVAATFTDITAAGTLAFTGATATFDGGTIDAMAIGGSTPAAGAFTSLSASTTLAVTTTSTLTGAVSFGGEIVETVYAIPSSTTPSLDPGNGTIQTWTLTGASTPTEVLADGESLKLTIAADTNSYGVTWTSVVTKWIGGTAPSLGETAGDESHIELWQEGTTVYGSFIGVSS